MIGQTISHYRILSKLGEGGMGVVYLAEDTLLGRRVAIKTLNVELGKQHYRQRFLREAQAVSALNHPNIAIVHDYGETTAGQPFIVMELVQGPTLEDLLSRKELTLSRALKIIEDVARALAEAHRRGIIHRDIKPSNVAINERDEVKVLDFGLAKNLNADYPTVENDAERLALFATQTREGVVIGTPLYLSPEQALGISVDARSDIFALGSLLYECLAGCPAFPGISPVDICAKVIRDDPPAPSQFNSQIPAELDLLTLKLLAKKPEDRFQSADALLEALRAVRVETLDERQAQPTPAPSPSGLRERARTTLTYALQRPRHFLSAFLLAVFVGFASWGAWHFWKSPETHEPPPEAKQWYIKGTNALRDGTYYQASKMLGEAVKLDGKYAIAHARLAESLTELSYTDKANSEMSRANMLVVSGEIRLNESDSLYLKAVNATVLRDFGTAIDSYRDMMSRVREDEKAYLYVDLGRAYEKNEDLDNALECYRQAIQADSQYAAAYLRTGILSARQHDFQKAVDALSEAKRLYEAQTNMEGVTESLYQRSILFILKGDYAQARKEFDDALNVARTINSTYQQIRILLQLSRVSNKLGQIEQAKQYAMQAIRLAQTNEIHNLAAQGLIDLGNVYFVRSEIAQAEDYFSQALKLAQSQQLRSSEARALLSLGSLYVQQDDADEGLQYIEKALPFYEQGGYKAELVQAQTLKGQAYDLKGDYYAALRAFDQLLQLAQQWGKADQAALAYDGIGMVLAHQERYAEALSPLENSYSIYTSQKTGLFAGYTLINRADVLWRLGRYQEARAALNMASSLVEQTDEESQQLRGKIDIVSAPMALSERRFSEAIAWGQRVMATDDSRTKHPTIEVKYTVGLAQALSGLKQQGLKTCSETIDMAERTGDPRLLASALLAFAETQLISDNAPGALTSAQRAQELFTRAGQVESEWRAWLIAGRASQQLKDFKAARNALSHADAALASLRQRWGEENFNHYLDRPDIKLYREELAKAATAAQ
jgi:serine/threonine protein kinase